MMLHISRDSENDWRNMTKELVTNRIIDIENYRNHDITRCRSLLPRIYRLNTLERMCNTPISPTAPNDILKRAYDGGDPNPLLVQCAATGDIDTVKELLNHGADIKHDRYSAFRVAAAAGKYDLVKYFIDRFKDFDMITAVNNYAFVFAAANGHTEIVRLLHENGASNIDNNRYDFAYMLAMNNLRIDTVVYMLTIGNVKNHSGQH